MQKYMYDINRIQEEIIINQVVNSLTSVIERKMDELHERDASPFINGINGLARYLNIGTTLAQELKNDKKIPSYQNGRTVWFKKNEINRYVESNKN